MPKRTSEWNLENHGSPKIFVHFRRLAALIVFFDFHRVDFFQKAVFASRF